MKRGSPHLWGQGGQPVLWQASRGCTEPWTSVNSWEGWRRALDRRRQLEALQVVGGRCHAQAHRIQLPLCTSTLPTLPPWNCAPVGEGAPRVLGSPPGSSWISACVGRLQDGMHGRPGRARSAGCAHLGKMMERGHCGCRSLAASGRQQATGSPTCSGRAVTAAEPQATLLTRCALIGWVGSARGLGVQLRALLLTCVSGAVGQCEA